MATQRGVDDARRSARADGHLLRRRGLARRWRSAAVERRVRPWSQGSTPREMMPASPLGWRPRPMATAATPANTRPASSGYSRLHVRAAGRRATPPMSAPDTVVMPPTTANRNSTMLLIGSKGMSDTLVCSPPNSAPADAGDERREAEHDELRAADVEAEGGARRLAVAHGRQPAAERPALERQHPDADERRTRWRTGRRRPCRPRTRCRRGRGGRPSTRAVAVEDRVLDDEVAGHRRRSRRSPGRGRGPAGAGPGGPRSRRSGTATSPAASIPRIESPPKQLAHGPGAEGHEHVLGQRHLAGEPGEQTSDSRITPNTSARVASPRLLLGDDLHERPPWRRRTRRRARATSRRPGTAGCVAARRRARR